MSSKSEFNGSVPEIRQQVFEQWYGEWETPEETRSLENNPQPSKLLAPLRSTISRLIRPQPAATPHLSGENMSLVSRNPSS